MKYPKVAVLLLLYCAKYADIGAVTNLSTTPSTNYSIYTPAGTPTTNITYTQRQITPSNITQQIISLTVNGSLINKSFLVYYNKDYLCFMPSDAKSLLSNQVIFFSYKNNGKEYNCLNNSPNNNFTFDETTNMVNLTINPQLLPFESINLTKGYGPVFSDPPLNANTTLYQLYMSQTATNGINNSMPSLTFQNQMSTDWGTIVNIGGYSSQNNFVRNQSYFQSDFPSKMTSLIVGDTNSYPGQWGNSIFYGGAHYGSNINLQPFTVFSTTPMIQGQAALPSTAQLLLNNKTPLGSTDVGPGPFSISNIPIINGNGTVTMLLKNSTGAVYNQVTIPFYASANILKQNSYQYRYDLGLPNNNYGGLNTSYQESQLFFSTDHTYGVTNQYTVDLRNEIQPGSLYNIGATHNFLIFNQMVANLSTAVSTSPNWGTGALLGFGLSRQVTDTSKISYGYQLTLTTPQFQQLGIVTATGQDYPIQQTLFLNVPITSSSSISLGTNQQSQINYGDSTSYNSTLLWQITRSINLSISAMYTQQPQSGGIFSAFANLNYIFKNNASLQTNLQNSQQSGNSSYGFTSIYQYNDPTNTYGYNVGGGLTSNTNAMTNQYPSNLIGGGFYNFKNFTTTVQSNIQNDQNYSVNGSVQGSIIVSKDKINFGRYSNLSFALVSVGKIPNVSVLLNGTFIGKTDRDGYFLVPNIQSYLPQKIAIDPNTLPINIVLDDYEKKFVAPLNAGVKISFDPVKYTPAMVILKISKNSFAPTGINAKLYQEDSGNVKVIEDIIVAEDGLTQITRYSTGKNLYVEFMDNSGTYKCPLKESIKQSNPNYLINLDDSMCQKQF